MESAKNLGNFGFTRLSTSTGDYYVVFHFMWDVHDRSKLGGLLGFTVDMQYLRDHYFNNTISAEALRRKRLPGFPAPTALIVDDRDQSVYSSEGARLGSDDGEATFPLLFFDEDLLETTDPLRDAIPFWTLRSGYTGTTIASIVAR
jgi:hypothetical protein